jgi:hypothetical protein
MPFDRFMIAPMNTGLELDLKPWQIPDDAFTQLQNAYVFRGRVRKRFGGELMGYGSPTASMEPFYSRLGISLGNTDGETGDITGNLTATFGITGFKIGQIFVIGTALFTVTALGTPANLLRSDGVVATATLNTTTGAFVINGATIATAAYFYPSQPVMGLANYELGAINNQPSFAFDTQMAYNFQSGYWQQSNTTSGAVPVVWHGTNSDLFWTTNWTGIVPGAPVMFVSNFNASVGTNPLTTDDPIWTYGNPANNWATFLPQTTQPKAAGYLGNFVQSARIVIPFKDRLVLLNTIENNGYQTYHNANSINTSYPQRCRYSHNGSPFPTGQLQIALTGGAAVGITDGAGNATGTVPSINLFPGKIGMRFSIGTEIFTVTATGTPGVMTTTGGSATHTYNTTTGAYAFTGAAATTQVYFYPEVSAWLEPNLPGYSGAGYIDATTDEQIVSAEFIKDRLIVYFEKSTWELAYTGNQVLPFTWQKINTELGSQSTLSSVPFDKLILTVSNTGILACNGANVERIDNKIPDNVFEIDVTNAARVTGIRDYYTEMVYWAVPTTDAQTFSNTFPNQVLVYNYKNGSWAYNDDCITAFGYFEQQRDLTWEAAQGTWEGANFSWNSGVEQAQSRQVIAGNQQGFVYIIKPEEGYNAPVMQITNMVNAAPNVTLTVVDHTLNVDDYVKIDYALGSTNLNGAIYQIVSVTNANTFSIAGALEGSYLGGGFITRISNINITSKQWNPYVKDGRNVYIQRIDFCVDKTSDGQVTVDYYPSSTALSMNADSAGSGSALSTGVLETSPYEFVNMEQYQQRLWHPIYLQCDGETIQIKIYMSDEQMRDVAIAESGFELEAMILHCMPTSDRLR